MNDLTLIGMPGSGKSTVGVLLAKTLGYDFLDVDLVIQKNEGALLQDILDSRGLEEFLDAEERAILGLSPARTVLAPGGSCVCREDAMAHLKSLGPVVYLRVSPGELRDRLGNFTTRGIALAPGETFDDLYAFRAPLYARWADLTVDADGQTLFETVTAVREALRKCGYIA